MTTDRAEHETAGLSPLAPEIFRDAIGHFMSGVTIVTTIEDGKPLGTTASAISSLSLEPPMLLVCMNVTSETGQAIERTGRFAVNVLAEHHGELAKRFAGKGTGKFDGVPFEFGPTGQPLFEDALATLECRVGEHRRVATHMVHFAHVEHASAVDGKPLCYFCGRFHVLGE